MDEAELLRLGDEFVTQLGVSDDGIRDRWRQAEDPSGEWNSQRKG